MKIKPVLLLLLFSISVTGLMAASGPRPDIILVMADDQGWGQTGYYNHPVLKTPNIDAMSVAGLRFDRFYAGAPNCSPTRATVMTGRSNDRTGVYNHGHAMRRQERTIAQALAKAGYTTGHFGKWHLNGIRGPGVPVLSSDVRNPGRFGFDEWLSVTNFFDLNPLMSRKGTFEEFQGDSSEVVVEEALKFLREHQAEEAPMFVVIWFGTPHSPWTAKPDDKKSFSKLKADYQNHYGELVAMDRAIGKLRSTLRETGDSQNTLVWYCSDNGGLPNFGPETVGGLRGWKGSLWEGGIRVPSVIEWPTVISAPRVTSFPATTLDIFPTLAEIVGLPESAMVQPQDGISLRALLTNEIGPRKKPIPFRHTGRTALVDNDYKLVIEDLKAPKPELYNLADDPKETVDLAAQNPDLAQRMQRVLLEWNQSVDDSIRGKDYAEGKLAEPDPDPVYWSDLPSYKDYLESWKERPEYGSWLERK